MSRRLHLVVAIATSAVLCGCDSGMQELEQRVSEIKRRQSGEIEPIPQIKRFESFIYLADDRRDPFIPEVSEPSEVVVNAGPAPDLNRNKEPLEDFPLDGLRMSGTIQAGGTTYALVRAPDGVIHRVSVGNYMGQNYGQIKSIDESQVQISELVEDGFGGWVPRPASLALGEP